MEWIKIDKARIMSAMSPTRIQTYQGWLVQDPSKQIRVEEIIEFVVMEWRTGIASNARNYLDPDRSKLPESCVRYCETLIMFQLCTEMGAPLTQAELVAIQKAEIFLRLMYTRGFFFTAGDGSQLPSPSYMTTRERERRQVAG